MDFKTTSFEQFWAEVGAGIRFTEEDIAIQMADSLLDPKDAGLSLIHRDRGYFIPRMNIEAYFETHAKPFAPLSKDAVIDQQKRRIAELEAQLSGAAKSTADVRRIDPLAGSEVASAPYANERDTRSDEEVKAQDKMTPDEIRSSLANDLKDKKPKPLRDITPTAKARSVVTENPPDSI
jgi:hypothetical protein